MEILSKNQVGLLRKPTYNEEIMEQPYWPDKNLSIEGSTEYYKNWYSINYEYGIFNIHNDGTKRPWSWQYHTDFCYFRESDSHLSIWQRDYQPGITFENLHGINGSKMPQINYNNISESMHSIFGNKLKSFSKIGPETDKFLFPKKVDYFGDFIFQESFRYISRLDWLTNWSPKGVVPGDFVVSIIRNGKIESFLSFTKILSPGDLLHTDRVSINKGSVFQFLDEYKDSIDLIKKPDATDLSYLNIGEDVCVNKQILTELEGVFNFHKILNEINPVPASSWLVDFGFLVGGILGVGTIVWGFYFLLMQTKRYLELGAEWDRTYKYWHPLFDHRTLQDKELARIQEQAVQEVFEWNFLVRKVLSIKDPYIYWDYYIQNFDLYGNSMII